MPLPPRPLTVLHLVGSAVSDLYVELSVLYARDYLEATADPARYTPFIAYVTPRGAAGTDDTDDAAGATWRFPADLSPAAIAAAPPMPVADAIARITAIGPDVAVPQMFCVPGMTTYRALLDLLGIPFVGNAPDVMALGAHKARARAVVQAAGVDVPAGELLVPGQSPTLAPPTVVKPVDADNSLGVTLVRTAAEYPAALAAAFTESGGALVESYIELGREVRCGIVERDGELVMLPLEEYRLDPARGGIRSYADKIDRTDGGDLTLVAKETTKAWIVDPADPVTERVWELARRCHVALGCRHYSLVDVRIDPTGRPFFLEAGLYCSFATTSVVAMMAAAAGIGLAELFATAVAQALAGASWVT